MTGRKCFGSKSERDEHRRGRVHIIYIVAHFGNRERFSNAEIPLTSRASQTGVGEIRKGARPRQKSYERIARDYPPTDVIAIPVNFARAAREYIARRLSELRLLLIGHFTV
jgi:hypothetical protein